MVTGNLNNDDEGSSNIGTGTDHRPKMEWLNVRQ